MPRLLSPVPLFLFLLLIGFPGVASAEDLSRESESDDGRIPWFPVLASELKGPYLAADGALLLGGAKETGSLGYGSELRLGVVWRPVSDLIVGPRVGASFLRAGDSTRADFGFGGETTLWFVNAIGVGGGADYLLPVGAPAGDASKGHARLESHLRVRMFRFGRFSAAAPRMSVTYDFTQGWGVQAGLHLQFGGVP